jgi:hypothetical protein
VSTGGTVGPGDGEGEAEGVGLGAGDGGGEGEAVGEGVANGGGNTGESPPPPHADSSNTVAQIEATHRFFNIFITPCPLKFRNHGRLHVSSYKTMTV